MEALIQPVVPGLLKVVSRTNSLIRQTSPRSQVSTDKEAGEWFLDFWVFVFVIVMCVVFLNLLIGILGEALHAIRASGLGLQV